MAPRLPRWLRLNRPRTKVSKGKVEKAEKKAVTTSVSIQKSDLLKFKKAVEILFGQVHEWKENRSYAEEYGRFYYFTNHPGNVEDTAKDFERYEIRCGELLNFNKKVKESAARIKAQLKAIRDTELLKKEEEAITLCKNIDKEIRQTASDLRGVYEALRAKLSAEKEDYSEFKALSIGYLEDAIKQLSKILKQLDIVIQLEEQVLRVTAKAA